MCHTFCFSSDKCRDCNKDFPYEAKELHMTTTPLTEWDYTARTEALTNRTGFAFPCHFKKYLFFREWLMESEKAFPKFLRAFKPREFSLKAGRVNG